MTVVEFLQLGPFEAMADTGPPGTAAAALVVIRAATRSKHRWHEQAHYGIDVEGRLAVDRRRGRIRLDGTDDLTQYEPATIAAVAAATSLAAAELVRRLRETPREHVTDDHHRDPTP
jgi:hypothetical protein